MDHLLEAASMREPTPTSELPTSELPVPELSAPVVAADASGLIIQVAALPLEVPTSAETTPLPLEGGSATGAGWKKHVWTAEEATGKGSMNVSWNGGMPWLVQTGLGLCCRDNE